MLREPPLCTRVEHWPLSGTFEVPPPGLYSGHLSPQVSILRHLKVKPSRENWGILRPTDELTNLNLIINQINDTDRRLQRCVMGMPETSLLSKFYLSCHRPYLSMMSLALLCVSIWANSEFHQATHKVACLAVCVFFCPYICRCIYVCDLVKGQYLLLETIKITLFSSKKITYITYINWNFITKWLFMQIYLWHSLLTNH